MQIIAKRAFGFDSTFVFFVNIIPTNLNFCNELSTLFLDCSAQFVDTVTCLNYTNFDRSWG